MAPHGHQILVVDDTDDTREGFAAILRGSGFTVVTAWSAEDALRQFREGFRPCIALLDLRMPGMDGWALWDRMQEEPDSAIARVPVVIVSGDIEQHERARTAGVREFLRKPVEPAQLVAVVERYCERRTSGE
jgi:two-component system sensor histidine kinase/response regulator